MLNWWQKVSVYGYGSPAVPCIPAPPCPPSNVRRGETFPQVKCPTGAPKILPVRERSFREELQTFHNPACSRQQLETTAQKKTIVVSSMLHCLQFHVKRQSHLQNGRLLNKTEPASWSQISLKHPFFHHCFSIQLNGTVS